MAARRESNYGVHISLLITVLTHSHVIVFGYIIYRVQSTNLSEYDV